MHCNKVSYSCREIREGEDMLMVCTLYRRAGAGSIVSLTTIGAGFLLNKQFMQYSDM